MKVYIPRRDLLRYWWLTLRYYKGPKVAVSSRWSDLDGAWPLPNPHGVFFTGCDAEYFRLYGENYLNSVATSGGRQSVHLHIYNGDDDQVERALAVGRAQGLAVTVTRDRARHSALYSEYVFAAGRFVLLPRLLAATRSPVICTDVDVLVRGSFDQSVSALAGSDVSLYLRDSSTLPWRKVLASTVIAMPTPGGQRYFDRVAMTLQEILKRPLRHHVDQMILYFAFRHAQAARRRPLRFSPLAKTLIDWDFDERSLIWNAKGPERKPAYRKAALQMIAAGAWSVET